MRPFLYIGQAIYTLVFLTIVGTALVTITPYLIVSVLREKYKAMKQGKPVNWHISKEGL